MKASPEQIMDQLVHAKEYLRYKDLVAMGIISGRTDLARKKKTAGFPLPIKLTAAKSAAALYPRYEIMGWIRIQGIRRMYPKSPPGYREVTESELDDERAAELRDYLDKAFKEGEP